MHRFIVVSLLALGCRSGGSDTAAVKRCQAISDDGAARAASIELRAGSRVSATGIEPGRVPACADDPVAAGLLVAAVEARGQFPETLELAPLVVHVSPQLPPRSPPLRVIEYHRDSASIWVDRAATSLIDRSVWLHELAHAVMRAARPPGAEAAGLVEAIEEAAADYWAAVVTGSPALGRGTEARRLDQTSPLPISWSALGLPGRRFDSHRAGQKLASSLWLQRGPDPSLALDLLGCLGGARFSEPGLRAAVAAIIEACPSRSRSTIGRTIEEWLPSSLRPG